MRIEGFRSLNSEIETIINKSEAVKKAKKEKQDKLTPKEKKELSDEEKEYKSKRKEIQEKLIKFATRIPIFMYLTDYRERSLQDVITQLEPGLFKKVTGLDVKDFQLLCSIGVFNASLMNDAIFKFKRYEDSSLSYTGINKHEGEDIGGWDTVIKKEEYEKLFYNQQAAMEAPDMDESDVPDKPFVAVTDDDNEEEVTPSPKAKTIPIAPKTTTTYNTPNYITSAYGIKSPVAPQPKKVEKVEVDVSWLKIGTPVKHKAFGEGKVVRIIGDHLTVSFGKAEKTFIIPDCVINGFISKL